MPPMFLFLTLLGGLTFLALGAGALMRGTVGLAQLTRLPTFFIGLVIIAFGTSTPQLFTAIQASLSQTPVMALATVVGASIFNIFVTLGAVGLSGGAVKLDIRLWKRGNLPLALIATAVAGALAWFTLHGGVTPRWLGAVLLVSLALYVAFAKWMEHTQPVSLPLLKETRKLPPVIHIILFIAGLLGLILGANLLVDVTQQLTLKRELTAPFLGLTVLAVGTALPQLLSSMHAYREKQHTQLLNNLVGNTIFNLLGVCGLILAFSPIKMVWGGTILTSFFVLAGAAIALLVFTHPSMRKFKRAEAILFLISYAVFVGYVIHSM
ncbi:MAG: sodium:calcium antiporter [Blastochloris viridis]|uniref:Sodium:calcium antiporter n=1 Tax=Blastochloris viridis TaxID=1079 RepID=A0A6N4RAD2_BLAVI|nr:MAG: sodium:calcium antiporter [Blastochloris viridis]